MSNNNFEHGKLGEFICATHLLKMGEKTEIVNLSTIDLIRFIKSLEKIAMGPRLESTNFLKI